MAASPHTLAPFPWIDVAILAALMLLNGVFAMSELAIVSSRKPRLEAMARKGSSGARMALTLAADPGKFLSTVQTGITLIGVIAGGVPQLPMAGPQMVEQLLRRPTALATAARAAGADDDATLGACLLEALRFDPMARILPRVGLVDHTVADGTRRAKTIHAGTDVILWVASGMMDPRRLDAPHSFRATRPPSAYMHFGCGHHECFGIHINRAILPAVLKPLLRMPKLRRAPGAAGRLRKQGLFAESLTVLYDRG